MSCIDTTIIVQRVPRETRLGLTVADSSLAFASDEFPVYTDIFLDPIPTEISFLVGATYDLSPYIHDPGGRIVSSRVLNLNTNIATYSHATKRLTGVSEGVTTGLRLEVSTDTVTITTIPAQSIKIGQTADLGPYIDDPAGLAVNSQVIGLTAGVATYSHATKLITGVGAGNLTNLQLQVEF
jgi:hypothetical protein